MKTAKIASLLLLILSFAGGSWFFSSQTEAKSDSIGHQIIQEPSMGLSVVETSRDANMYFSNPLVTTLSKDKLLAVSLNANQNKSPFLVDPYIYLQFSFISEQADENYLYFDATNPTISERLLKNSLYYPTTEEGYNCPNRAFADSGSYFFLIKEGFSGTIFISLSDYFDSDFAFNKFRIFSDANNHWNSYEILEVFLCDDVFSTNKKPMLDLSSYSYDSGFQIVDENLTYQNQDIKRVTTLLNRVVKAHVTQSRATMLNVSNQSNSGQSDVVLNVDKNGYKIRDVLIVNINNLSVEDLLFNVFLVDGNNIEIPLKVSSSDTYVLAKTDIISVNLTCDGEYVRMPASTINSTLLLAYSNFESTPAFIKAIKFVFKNTFECEIGKIIDAQNTLTGNFKTISNPINYKDTTGIDITEPTQGSSIFTTTSKVVFKFNDDSIYEIVKIFNANQGELTHKINGDYVDFLIASKSGFALAKAYVNGVLVNVENDRFTIPFTSDIHVAATFKEAKIYLTVDDNSRALLIHEKSGSEIVFRAVLANGFVVDNARFNGSTVSLNADNTYYANDNLSQYEFEITTREINVAIDYVDKEENRHGSCSFTIVNSKVYLCFEPDQGYQTEKIWIDGQEIDFKGKIYSLNANNDLCVMVKFFKR